MISGLLLLWTLGCDGPAETPVVEETVAETPTGPPTSRGVVLYVEEGGLTVQHDDTLGRLNPGVEHYPAPAGVLRSVEVGQRVDLWLSGADEGGRKVDALAVTGTPGVPDGFVAGGYPLRGTVIRVDRGTLTVDHEAIDGVMAAMVMPFRVGARAAAFEPGDRVEGRLLHTSYGWALVELAKTGDADAALRSDVDAIEVGDVLPATEVTVEDGSTVIVGEGQDRRTLLTFIYTRCPDPTFCPALVARLLALQAQIGPDVRLLTVTLDPLFDTPEVLARYGRSVSAEPDIWRLGHLDPVALNRLAMQAGLAVTERDGRIAHLLRLLVLDTDGRLVERYDDNRWPLDRVVRQLKTGEPVATRTGTLSDPG